MKQHVCGAYNVSFLSSILRPWRQSPQSIMPSPEEMLDERRKRFREGVSDAIRKAYVELAATGVPARYAFPLEPYTPPKGVVPSELSRGLAMDASWNNLVQDSSFYLGNLNSITATVLDGLGFPGFPYLTELAQITEYRDMSERTAAEMTRKWVELRSKGDDDKTDIIARLNTKLERFQIRERFRHAATLDGFMGRAQLFPNFGDVKGQELESPLMLNHYKIKKGSLRGFKVVEPVTTYPADFNSTNPLASDYYIPSSWWVYGQKIHASRLLTFESRPLPDLLKPVYNFSGMSLSQLAQPYVDYWFGTRDSIGRLLKNFSITNLATDLDVLLQTGGDDLIKRAQLFSKFRDNQGLFMTNKDTEVLTQLNTPLSGLADLQAQAQEHMAAVAKTPLVILLGITPKGLNPSAEGEVRIYYDYVADQQEKLFRKNLELVLQMIMLDELGYIDEDITFDFLPLFALTGKEEAMIRKSDSERDTAMIQAGVLSPLEVRAKLSADPSSGYNGIDVDDLPAPPPVPAGPPTGKGKDEQGSVTEDPGFTAEANAGDTTADVALDIMRDADRLVHDGGFRGNQHIGGVSEKDGPLEQAMKLTASANVASRTAGKLGTRRAHRKALVAHSRALEAHERALSSANPSIAPVHETYIDAHRSAADVHRGSCGGAQ
jgi:phage-related protein (TIGR01555 family)